MPNRSLGAHSAAIVVLSFFAAAPATAAARAKLGPAAPRYGDRPDPLPR